jgi:hypothetical protein
VPVSDLPPWAREPFTVPTLNRICKLYPIACGTDAPQQVCSLLCLVHIFEKPYTAVLGESAYALFYLTRYSFHMLVQASASPATPVPKWAAPGVMRTLGAKSRELVHIYVF